MVNVVLWLGVSCGDFGKWTYLISLGLLLKVQMRLMCFLLVNYLWWMKWKMCVACGLGRSIVLFLLLVCVGRSGRLLLCYRCWLL